VWHESRVDAPIVPLALLRIPAVAACCALAFICFAVMITLTVMVPLRAQWVQGLSVDTSAWRLMSMSMGVPVAAFYAGNYMYRKARIRPLLWAGVAIVPPALLALVALPPTLLHWVELPCLFLVGFGIGLQMPTTLVASQHAVGRTLIGTVTALSSLSRQLGGAAGVAILSALLLALMQQHLPAGHSGGLEALVQQLSSNSTSVDRSAVDANFRAVLWGCLGCALLSLPFALRLPDTQLDEPH
jgi:hypothetical protein